MTSNFSIGSEWLSSESGSPEIRETSAFISIAFDDYLATRCEDGWSKSIRPNVRASAYPLALWFAASWWRLRWEPSYDKKTQDSDAWRMAHELPATGHGFIWPRLIFASDGEAIDVTCLPSSRVSPEMIKYLELFHTSTAAAIFEQTASEFISLVLARLNALGIQETSLHALWEEVNEERANPEAAAYRRLEARLGFDPDDAPEALVERLLGLMPRVGPEAIGEVAPACAGSDPVDVFDRIVQLAASPGIEATFPITDFENTVVSPVYARTKPWDRGRLLARAVRARLSLGNDRLSSKNFSALLGVSPSVLERQQETQKPLSLGVRDARPEVVKLIFRRRSVPGRRFEAARLLGDHINAPVEERWLPATDAKTVRQKIQRAFAAEFLCPIDRLKDFLGQDYSSDDAINEAGDYFGISPLAVRSHLANHGLIDRKEVFIQDAW